MWQKEQEETEWITDDEEEEAKDKAGKDIEEAKDKAGKDILEESMALNDGFMALETMRKGNLEVEFGGKAIPGAALLHEYCTAPQSHF